jgi:holin-like protein
MIGALAAIFLCQLIGETLVRAFALPLPGPVFGMALLFFVLLARGGQGEEKIPAPLASAADGLLGHLSLLFVPAAVGLMNYFGLLADNTLAIVLAVVVSTVLTMAATAATFQLLARSAANASAKGDRT